MYTHRKANPLVSNRDATWVVVSADGKVKEGGFRMEKLARVRAERLTIEYATAERKAKREASKPKVEVEPTIRKVAKKVTKKKVTKRTIVK